MSFALVGLAIGLGARYPRFGADPSQVAGSYGGVAFMMLAVLFVIVMIVLLGWPSSVYLLQRVRGRPLSRVAAVADGAVLRRRRGAEPRDLARVDALRRPRAASAWATSGRRGRDHPRITGLRGLRHGRITQTTCSVPNASTYGRARRAAQTGRFAAGAGRYVS